MSRLIPDMPSTTGMRNALRRARQLAQLRWTPVCPFPAGIKTECDGKKEVCNIFLPAWRPQIGANYSASRFDEKYVGFNVSIETYMTALSNPNSVLYSRSLHGKAPLSSAYYGTVCSEFVSYVMDLPFHIDCQQWPFLDGVEKVNTDPLENLRLCDILNEATHHTAVITGIDRDDSGKIVQITVTESTLPNIQSRTYTCKEFTEYWLKNNYEVLRYRKLDEITYSPCPWVYVPGDPQLCEPALNAVLMPDYGNRANYFKGECVRISVFDSAFTQVELLPENGSAEYYTVEKGMVELHQKEVGFYQARAFNGTAKSEKVEFCIVDAEAKMDKRHYREGEAVRVYCSCVKEDKLLGWVVKTPDFAKVWGYPAEEDGSVPEKAALKEGAYRIIALYKNKYGVYASHPSDIFIVEK